MERLIALGGMAAILFVAICLSNNRKAINWRTAAIGIGCQVTMALLIFKVPVTRDAFNLLGDGVHKLVAGALDGAEAVFGEFLVRNHFIFAINIGASILVIGAISAMLYYLGIMQFIIRLTSKALVKTLGISSAEGVAASGAVLVGQVENMFFIKPYLAKLSSSQLFCCLTVSMATISGSALAMYTAAGMNPTFLIAASLMSAPGAIVIAKIMFPETEEHALAGELQMGELHTGVNLFDAFAVGALDAKRVAVNVMVLVLVAVGLVSILNTGLGSLLSHFGVAWTVQDIFGTLFTPIAFMLGVPWHEAFHVGRLMATEIIINEFVAYSELSKVIAGTGAYVLSAKTQMITTIALCGFANLGSIAINIGGLGEMAPERRPEIARIAFRALVAANFATWMSAAIAGVLL